MAQQKPKETNFDICITSVLRNKELSGTKNYQKELLQRAGQVPACEFSDVKKHRFGYKRDHSHKKQTVSYDYDETECYSIIHCFYYSRLFHI